jgi:hypothetical protein
MPPQVVGLWQQCSYITFMTAVSPTQAVTEDLFAVAPGADHLKPRARRSAGESAAGCLIPVMASSQFHTMSPRLIWQ